ncbi:type VI secretion system protein TssA [Halioxenophilus aromaticivorans]|uniref:Type VI secretion system protein TssA n=1 Tax=Halioxenophilus aromaticivorans TaxID=1306992 RepID=A0AAV3U341_9ALTE
MSVLNESHSVIADNVWLKMLAPVSNDLPAGTDTREDISPTSLYQEIRDARVLARNNERATLSSGDASYFSLPEWSIILDRAPDLIAHQSKDLEIVAWYIEALARHYGFAGIAAGFTLAKELLSNYSDSFFPRPDEDGISTQLAALSGLNGFGAEGTLIGPIKSILITQGDYPGPLATWQCEQAFEIARIKDDERRTARLKQGGVSKDELDVITLQTDTHFLQSTLYDIDAAISAFADYQSVLDVFAETEPQPTGKIKEALEHCRQTLVYLAGPRINTATEPELEQESTDEQQQTLSEPGEIQRPGAINSRAQAILQLSKIADYFKKTEPHSPISYSIEQAIRWSELPLTELIKELIPDEPARKTFKHLSGISAESST